MRFLISIATYKRPKDLLRLLDSLQKCINQDVNVVVTDNDPDESAARVAKGHPIRPTYTTEKTPGIAHARNHGLNYFTPEYDVIVFLDDDEWVEQDWFENLHNFLSTNNADVVQGPVITELPTDAPHWVTRGGFYQRQIKEDGTLLPSAATNNTALRRSIWVSAGEPRFDPNFSETGGSDWDLFWGLRKAGAKIVYASNVVVSEDVPSSRLSKQWIQQRFIRNGIVETRVRLKHRDGMLMFVLHAVATLTFGCFQLTYNFVLGRGLQSRPLSRVLIPYGKLTALFGKRIREYKR